MRALSRLRATFWLGFAAKALAAALQRPPLQHVHLDLAKNQMLTDRCVEVLCSQLPCSITNFWFSLGPFSLKPFVKWEA